MALRIKQLKRLRINSKKQVQERKIFIYKDVNTRNLKTEKWFLRVNVSRLTALGGLGGWKDRAKKRKKTERSHGLRQQCGNCRGEGVDGGRRGHGGINGNDKKYH